MVDCWTLHASKSSVEAQANRGPVSGYYVEDQLRVLVTVDHRGACRMSLAWLPALQAFAMLVAVFAS